MLAVVEQNPCEGPVEEVMRAVARSLGVEHTMRKASAGVFFARDGSREPGTTVPDPYFSEVGPARTGCTACGNCMVGMPGQGEEPPGQEPPGPGCRTGWAT
jgi:cholesterol oxidase